MAQTVAKIREQDATVKGCKYKRYIGTLFKHYRRAIREDEAEKFWKIMPSQKSAVIAFPSVG